MNGSFESAGTRLAFRDSGTGQPIVFLHPTPLDAEYWQPLIDKLEGVRAISLDFRGHGASQLGHDLPVGGFSLVPDAPVLTMAQLASDVLALLDHLHIQQAIFAGCSIGGYVLLDLWRLAPSRIRGMAFVCSKPQPDAEANLPKRAATIAEARAGRSSAVFDGMAQALIGATARAGHPEIVPVLRARMILTPESLVAVQAGLAVRPDSLPNVGTINVPVLAICGGEDPVITPAEMHVFQAAPGGCEFHLISDAGHFSAYEQPAKVAALLGSWLTKFKV